MQSEVNGRKQVTLGEEHFSAEVTGPLNTYRAWVVDVSIKQKLPCNKITKLDKTY